MASIDERIGEDGKKAYRVRVRIKGAPIEVQTFPRLTDAKKWAQSTEAAIREGRYFKTSESRSRTLNEALERYRETILPQKKKSKHSGRYQHNQDLQLKWWQRAIGHLFISDVTPAIIAQKRDQLLKEAGSSGRLRSGPTVCRYLAALSHLFTVAIKEWGWADANPVGKILKPKESKGRARFLDKDEMARLLKTCKESRNPYLLSVVVLALSTGMRKSEIMHLRWPDVDLVRNRMTLHDTKNGERRGISLSGYARELILELSKIKSLHTNLLFPAHFEIGANTQTSIPQLNPYFSHCQSPLIVMNLPSGPRASSASSSTLKFVQVPGGGSKVIAF